MEHLPISPAFEKKNLAITMQTSDFYAPYASVVALSIIKNASPAYNYDIIFMTWDMREETEKKLLSLAEGKGNVSVRVLDVLDKLEAYQKIAETSNGFNRFSYTGMIRLMLPKLLDRYQEVLNLDCDMLFCSDVSEVFQYDVSKVCMAAVPDVFCYTINHRPGEDRYSDEYMLNRLGLHSAAEYMNGGFLLLNLQMIRENYTTDQILDFAVRDGVILRCFEQDTFSGLFRDSKIVLPFEWNWFNDIPRLVGPFTKYLPADDAYLEAHRQAEAHIKNIHYVTDKKPWLTNTAYPHSKEWWSVALEGPFLNDVMARATAGNLHGSNEIVTCANPRVLFYCASGCQILNAVNIKYRFYKGIDADVVLDETGGAAEYKTNLEHAGLFHDIFTLKYDVRESEKTGSLSSPSVSYTDLYLPDSANAGAQIIFSRFAESKRVAVHLYEGGGCGAYTLDSSRQRGFFGDDITKCVKDIFLYDLEAHSNPRNAVPLIQIPQIRKEDARLMTLLRQAFGDCNLPDERYIFLQESFAEEGLMCNDSWLLDAVAEITGKDNIAVRLHPKAAPANEKLYRLHGYHVCPANHTPWEMAALLPGLENKVLLSISSTALISPYLACGSKAKAVSLFDLMPLSRRVKTGVGEYRRFLNGLRAEMNREKATLFCPKSMAELRMVLRYIEGDM